MSQPVIVSPPGPGFRGGLAGEALQRVLRYVDEHLGEHLTLDELARLAGVSRFHFARQFRVSTGESPMEYLRRKRIDRAKIILLTEDAIVAEVACRLGFADQSHFTRTFRRMVGTSPGSFAGKCLPFPDREADSVAVAAASGA